MKYLITGGAGFIGSHLAEALLATGGDVLVLDNFSTGRHENIAQLEGLPKFRFVYASVTEPEVVRQAVMECDQVFHLASAVGVQLIIDEPVKTIETIVEGTAVVLAACARFRKPVLITSTSEVYGKSQKTPFSEDDDSVIGPPNFRRWAYASAKALDEFLGLAWWEQVRLPVVIARLFNTIGPRQTGQYGMVVPRFVRQALAGEPIRVFGDGTQSRCFCNVADAVWALVRLIDTPAARGQVFNVGTDREITIVELAELVRRLAGSKSQIEMVPYRQAYGEGFEDMPRRVPNLAKIHRLLGYEPRWTLEQTLEQIIAAEKGTAETPRRGDSKGD